jgi:predicted ABC-type ATPase
VSGLDLDAAVVDLLKAHRESGKPLAVVLAGHNGSGKSTLWYDILADQFEIPLINADRMMLSILPERRRDANLPDWATRVRDQDRAWMQVAQKGVEAFVAQALAGSVPFAMETVFSYWQETETGVRSKVDMIREMQDAGYFVLLIFVGLSDAVLSQGRVLTRVAVGGHDVPPEKIVIRFPRTQMAVRHALDFVDAALMTDNSRTEEEAFTVCNVRIGATSRYDIRDGDATTPSEILRWLEVVVPR